MYIYLIICLATLACATCLQVENRRTVISSSIDIVYRCTLDCDHNVLNGWFSRDSNGYKGFTVSGMTQSQYYRYANDGSIETSFTVFVNGRYTFVDKYISSDSDLYYIVVSHKSTRGQSFDVTCSHNWVDWRIVVGIVASIGSVAILVAVAIYWYRNRSQDEHLIDDKSRGPLMKKLIFYGSCKVIVLI